MARLLHGKPIADAIEASLRERIAQRELRPALAVFGAQLGPAARMYAERLAKVGARLGIRVTTIEARDAASLRDAVERASADRGLHGVLLLTPLPSGVDASGLTSRIDPAKDVEGLHPLNLGLLASGNAAYVPSTAEAVLLLARESGVTLAGARAVVVGRSLAVGRPAALLLLAEHATVSVAHTATRDLAELTRSADVLVVAAGRAGLVRAEMVRPGAVVIDAGINATPEGIVGDVDFDSVSRVASALTPVPGGVGSLTTVLLLRNVVRAAESG